MNNNKLVQYKKKRILIWITHLIIIMNKIIFIINSKMDNRMKLWSDKIYSLNYRFYKNPLISS
jgi:hypothetical protein